MQQTDANCLICYFATPTNTQLLSTNPIEHRHLLQRLVRESCGGLPRTFAAERAGSDGSEILKNVVVVPINSAKLVVSLFAFALRHEKAIISYY